jgi:poly-gamma-glutamate biosynthesis protein PgsC/CapC
MEYEIVFVALVASLVYIGVTGFYPGGIIVPSYLVLFVHQPSRILGTLVAALVTHLCYKLASRYLIIFGRRMFVFMVLVGALWTFAWMLLVPLVAPNALEFRVIGWVIPGLIANNFERQGVVSTTASMITVTVAVYVAGRLLGLVA